MAKNTITLTLSNQKQLLMCIMKWPKEAKDTIQAAGEEAAKQEVIWQRGIKLYPPQVRLPMKDYWTAKQRRWFFWAIKQDPPKIEVPYVRGQNPKSERYGSQFYTKRIDAKLRIEVGNRASYGKYLGGHTTQSEYMKAKGWRTLYDVAVERLPQICQVYDDWIFRMLKAIGFQV